MSVHAFPFYSFSSAYTSTTMTLPRRPSTCSSSLSTAGKHPHHGLGSTPRVKTPSEYHSLPETARQKILAAEARLSAFDDSLKAIAALKKAHKKLVTSASTQKKKKKNRGNFQRRLHRRRNFPKDVRDMLIMWLRKRIDNPYPSDLEKQELSKMTNLDVEAISTWFTNARVRYLPRLKKEREQKMLKQSKMHNFGVGMYERTHKRQRLNEDGALRTFKKTNN